MIFVVIISLILLLIVLIMLSMTPADRATVLGRVEKFNYEGTDRNYRIHIPTGEVKNIIVGLHGFGDSGLRFAYYSGLHNVVDANTVVVYPEASSSANPLQGKGWNAGFCCGTGLLNDIDDAGFIVSLIEEIKQENDAPNAKVFATGFSNGAFMTQRLATDYPDVFTAVASISGSIGTTENSLKPTQPVPILITHGAKDRTIPFIGNEGKDPNFKWLSHAQTVAAWQAVNGTEAVVESKIYEQNGHKWQGWRIFNFWDKHPEQSIEIVDFFKSQ